MSNQPASRDVPLRGFTFSIFMTTAVITSYFPLYFQWKGFSAVQIGLLYSIGPMISIAANLIWGLLSDKYRTVKRVLTLLLAGQLLMAAFAFRTDGFGWLLALMASFFFFQTPMSSLTDSLTLLSTRRSGKSYASFRVFGSIGFACAALGFGLLLKQFGAGWTAALGLSTISLSLLLSFLLSDGREGRYKKPDFSALVPIVGSRPFVGFMATVLVISIAHRMNDGFLALFLHRLGADPSLVGSAWMISAVSEIPVFFLLSKYGHKMKELPLLAICCFFYVVRFGLMSLTNNPLFVLPIQLLHSLSFGIFFFTVLRYIQRAIPDQFRATGQALFTITWSGAGGLCSGLIGGFVFNGFGPHALYGVAAGLAMLSMVSFLLLNARLRTDSLTAAAELPAEASGGKRQ